MVLCDRYHHVNTESPILYGITETLSLLNCAAIKMNYSLSHTINANMLVWCLTVDHCWIVCCLFVFMWWKTAALWLHFASFAVPPMGALCGVGRLLHNPNLAAIGLSVGYETWPSIAWHHTFVIGLWKYRLGLPQSAMDCGLKIPVGIPTILQRPLTVPLHSPNGRLLPAVRAVQGDCERVYSCVMAGAPMELFAVRFTIYA